MACHRILHLVWILLVVAAFGGCVRTAPFHPSAELRAKTFDFYWEFVKENHPYLELPGVDWHAARDEHRDRAINARNTLDFYTELDRMFARLKDPHTNFNSNRYKTFNPSDPEGVWNIDLQTFKVQRAVYVYSWPGSMGCLPFHDTQYPQLLQVGTNTNVDVYSGESQWVMGEETLPIVAKYADGSLLRIDASAPRELMYGNHIGLFYASHVFAARFPFMADTSLELPTAVYQAPVYVHTSGFTLTAAESAIDHPFAHLERAEKSNPKSVRKPWWIDWKDLGPIRYIRISTFDDDSRDTGNKDRDVGGWIQVACNNIHEFDKVIIDLRYNGGGNAKFVQKFLEYFVSEPIRIIFDERREYFGLVTYVSGFRVNPRTPNFKGQIVVLVNQESASAAEWLATSLKSIANTTLIGETTIGAESPVTRVTGPDGSILSTSQKFKYPMPFAGYQSKGVTPDIQIPLTINRVREVGLAEAIRETEVNQVKAAGEVLGVDLTPYLRLY